jgi:hypothetical protein
VWGSGPNDVHAVGGAGQKSVVLRWNGHAWAPGAVDLGQPLFDVWLSGPGDIWVVGANAAFRDFGTGWRLLPDSDRISPHAIWGSSAKDVWLAGESLMMNFRVP